MGFVCQDLVGVNSNYQAAQKRYADKKNKLFNAWQQEHGIAGKDFFNLLSQNFTSNMQAKLTSPTTNRTVKQSTILRHLYNATRERALSVFGKSSVAVDTAVQAIRQLQADSSLEVKDQEAKIAAEINKIVIELSKRLNISDAFIRKFLPQMTKANRGLTHGQLIGYCKNIFKQQIQEAITGVKVQKAVAQYTAIVGGYLREDALADAAQQTIEALGVKTGKVKRIGSEKTSIDVLLSFGKGASVKGGKAAFGNLIQALDAISGDIVAVGQSTYNTSNFLGIQSKSWDLDTVGSKYVTASIGSRGALRAGFEQLLSGTSVNPNTSYGWHKGVKYLSGVLDQVIGANTIMYATGSSIIWTDQLLSDMVAKDIYFSFALDSNDKLTSHVILSKHICQ